MSDKIVDLGQERGKRDRPDPEYIRKDDFGRPMYVFLLEYEMDGSRWETRVWAYSFGDAMARVDAMRRSLFLLGQLHEEWSL